MAATHSDWETAREVTRQASEAYFAAHEAATKKVREARAAYLAAEDSQRAVYEAHVASCAECGGRR